MNDAPPQRRPVMFGPLMFIGLLTAQRAASHVRTIDFMLLLGGGMAFGVGFYEMVRFFLERRPKT